MSRVMMPKERFLTALAGGQPDRVPLFDFLFSPKLFEHVIGRRPETYNAEDVVACSFALGLDGVYIPFGAASSFQARQIAEHVSVDEWGVTIKADDTVSWPGGPPIDYPIKTREDWENYEPLNPQAPGRVEEVEAAIRLSADRLAILGGMLGPLTQAWWITGVEAFSIMLYDDPELAHRTLRAGTDYGIAAGRAMAATGVDALLIADDHGGTNGPMMSLPLFRRFVLPYFAEMVAAFRNLGLPVIMHNDGDIRIYLDDLVDTGIHAYHPVERAAGMRL
ncbi:MAG: uroporphyrinogen decarboxylase family protein, partial [Chloroflexi bacterium]|nr:uroporphyrinogen decarboxylase family protein [Chloroflexota bacterium]